jgi:hypothetical protein
MLCFVACATVAARSVQSTTSVRVEDRNGDGRPDVWMRFDDQGHRIEVDIDSNFDGHPDIQEYYQRDTLVRREVDRDFNGQTDLVEEFDLETGDRARSVVDVDNDGTADLLVLFRKGEPVFSKYMPSSSGLLKKDRADRRDTSTVRSQSDRLVPLDDPFRNDLSLSQLRVVPYRGGIVGLSTSGGLPASPADLTASLTRTSLASLAFAPAASPHFSTSGPRAPPIF